MSEGMQRMDIHIGLVDLPYEVELRFWLACRLLISSPMRVHLDKWNGQPCDIVVTDLDSERGQVAYELAMHGDVQILYYTEDCYAERPAGRYIDKQASASAIAKTLQQMFPLVPCTHTGHLQGLLGLCLIERGSGYELFARCGELCIVVSQGTRTIHARSADELLAAEHQLLDPAWTSVTMTASCNHRYDGLVSRSLDDFLTASCRRHQTLIPPMSDLAYRLKIWPDLIGTPDNVEALRLSSALLRKAWHVSDLAFHCGVTHETANAFCWAMWASNALTLDNAGEEVAANSKDRKSLPWMQRIARHFGSRARKPHADFR